MVFPWKFPSKNSAKLSIAGRFLMAGHGKKRTEERQTPERSDGKSTKKTDGVGGSRGKDFDGCIQIGRKDVQA